MLEIAVAQSVLLVILAAMLDGGVLVGCYFISLAGYWGSILALRLRVHGPFKSREVRYINASWIAIIPLGTAVALLVHRLLSR